VYPYLNNSFFFKILFYFQKNKFIEKDENYTDDFEQAYDDDFDDESAPPLVKVITKFPIGNNL